MFPYHQKRSRKQRVAMWRALSGPGRRRGRARLLEDSLLLGPARKYEGHLPPGAQRIHPSALPSSKSKQIHGSSLEPCASHRACGERGVSFSGLPGSPANRHFRGSEARLGLALSQSLAGASSSDQAIHLRTENSIPASRSRPASGESVSSQDTTAWALLPVWAQPHRTRDGNL